MAEYTYEDIIMDPNDPRLEGAKGKECYFSDYPKKLLNSARNNSAEYLDCLTNIIKEAPCPFVDKNGYGHTLIIIKKEEPKPEYISFKSMEEFVESYMEVKESVELNSFDSSLLQCGMWIKEKGISDGYYMITEIWNDGVILGYSKIFAIEEVSGRYSTVFETTTWDTLYKNFTFLDGSPCGKKVEENNG